MIEHQVVSILDKQSLVEDETEIDHKYNCANNNYKDDQMSYEADDEGDGVWSDAIDEGNTDLNIDGQQYHNYLAEEQENVCNGQVNDDAETCNGYKNYEDCFDETNETSKVEDNTEANENSNNYSNFDWSAPCEYKFVPDDEDEAQDSFSIEKCFEYNGMSLFCSKSGGKEEQQQSPILQNVKTGRGNRGGSIRMSNLTGHNVKNFLDCLLMLPFNDIGREAAMLETIKSTYCLFRQFDPRPLPLTFESAEEYCRRYTPLIIMDTWAQWAQEYAAIGQSLPKLNFGCIDIRSKRQGERLCLQARIAERVLKKHRDDYNFEKFVVILDEGGVDGFKCFGYVDSMSFNDKNLLDSTDDIPMIDSCSKELLESGEENFAVITFMLRVSNLAFMASIRDSIAVVDYVKPIIVRPLFYLRPSIRLIETLTIMTEHPLRYPFFKKLLQPSEQFCSLDIEEAQESPLPLVNGKNLNEQQTKAIRTTLEALSSPDDRLVMIQGPPGTGKTHTLIELVKNIFVHLSPPGNVESNLKVMICAPSNGAVDEIARRLLDVKLGSGQPLRLVRVGRRSQVHPSVEHLHIDNLLNSEQYAKSSQKPDQVRRSIIEHSHVILTTLASSHFSGLEFLRKAPPTNAIKEVAPRLNCVIVDEAAQCSEPELLMPLIYFVDKLVLVGDPQQLPATIMSNLAIKLNYGRSMFERFYEYFGQGVDMTKKKKKKQQAESTCQLVMLEKQFRMHPEIVQLPSHLFYAGRLQTPNGTGLNGRVQLRPYLVFDVTNTREEGVTSFSNPEEGKFVLRLLDGIVKSVIPHKVKIGVITFYRGQKQYLLEEMRSPRWSAVLKAGVTVDTVDSYQVRKKEILSTISNAIAF